MADAPTPPLNANSPIVDPQSGKPKPPFILLINQLLKATVSSASSVAQQALDAAKAAATAVTKLAADVKTIGDTEILGGVGLDGGGPLSGGDITLDLANTAVTPGTYGDATHSARLTFDQQGRVTAASSVAITGGGSGSGLVRETWAQVGSSPNTGAFGSRGGMVQPLVGCTVHNLYFRFAYEASASYIASIVTLDGSNNILTIVQQVTLTTPGVNTTPQLTKFAFTPAVVLTAGVKYGFLLTRTVTSGSAAFNMDGTGGTNILPNLGLSNITTYIRGTFNTVAVAQSMTTGSNSYWWAVDVEGPA